MNEYTILVPSESGGKVPKTVFANNMLEAMNLADEWVEHNLPGKYPVTEESDVTLVKDGRP